MKATVPRRIASTHEYINPKHFASIHYAQTDSYRRVGEADMAISVAFIVSNVICNYSVPCFFLKEEFLHSLVHTSPPDDMVLSDIKFPLDAMLLFYPEKFSLEYFGIRVLCTGIAKLHDKQIIKAPYYIEGIPNSYEVHASQSGVTSDISIFSTALEKGGTSTYYGNFPVNKQIKDIAIDNITYYGNARGINDPKVDSEIGNKLNSLAIKVILGMVSRPQYVEHGTLLRRAGIKKGVEINELWSPNYIGANYETERRGLGGTHASPRFHWRIGHFRNQHYGPQSSLVKLIWIEPTVVG